MQFRIVIILVLRHIRMTFPKLLFFKNVITFAIANQRKFRGL